MFLQNDEVVYESNLKGELYSIGRNTPMTTFLELLNEMEMKWQVPYEESKLDYAFIVLQSGVKIIYYLYDNALERIYSCSYT